MKPHRARLGVAICILLASACGDRRSAAATREVLPDGSAVLTYGDLSAAVVDTLSFDLVIVRADGEEWETFGRIAGLAADDTGAIYVLDSQAAALAADATWDYARSARGGRHIGGVGSGVRGREAGAAGGPPR